MWDWAVVWRGVLAVGVTWQAGITCLHSALQSVGFGAEFESLRLR